MRTIYIDPDYKCHLTNDGTMTSVETEFFDGKCAAFVEGYRFVPGGETWTRWDGVAFPGEMMAPWQEDALLEAYQQQYEAMLPQLRDMQTALNTLGVSVDG